MNTQELAQNLYQNLRGYQKEAIDKILDSSNKNILRQNFTGTGKSIEQNYLMIQHLADSESNIVLFLTHREELIENAAEYLLKNKLPLGYLMAGRKTNYWNSRIFLGMIGSLQKKRLEEFKKFQSFKNKNLLIIIDETHHASAKTWKNLLSSLEYSKKVGFTATPERLDGQGLDDIFDEMIIGYPYQWYIDNKYVSPFKILVPEDFEADFSKISVTKGDYSVDEQANILEDNEILGDIVQVWNDYVVGKKTVIFAPKIHTSKMIVEKINEFSTIAFGRNIAEHLDGTTNKTYRRECIQRFKLPKDDPNSLIILSNVDLFNEGVNIPDCEVTYWLRKTKSATFFDQGNGRSNRFKEGKCQYIIDAVGNLIEHGTPNRERVYFLEGRKKKELKEKYRLYCSGCNTLLIEDFRESEDTPWLDCGCGMSTMVPKFKIPKSKFKLKCTKCAKLLLEDYRKHKEHSITCSCGEINDIPNREKPLEIIDTEFKVLDSKKFEEINNFAIFSKYSRLSNKEYLDTLAKSPYVTIKFLQEACKFRNLPNSYVLSAWSRVQSLRNTKY